MRERERSPITSTRALGDIIRRTVRQPDGAPRGMAWTPQSGFAGSGRSARESVLDGPPRGRPPTPTMHVGLVTILHLEARQSFT